MKLSRRTIIFLLAVSIFFLMIAMAIQVQPEFFNITDETFGITGNKVVSLSGSALLIVVSLFTILLYRKNQEK